MERLGIFSNEPNKLLLITCFMLCTESDIPQTAGTQIYPWCNKTGDRHMLI